MSQFFWLLGTLLKFDLRRSEELQKAVGIDFCLGDYFFVPGNCGEDDFQSNRLHQTR